MPCSRCSTECACTKTRKEYTNQYRVMLKEKSKTECKCGIIYSHHNSKIHIDRHNNSRIHIKYLYDNDMITLDKFIPVMLITELRKLAKQYDIKNYMDYDKNHLKDVVLTYLLEKKDDDITLDKMNIDYLINKIIDIDLEKLD